MEERKPDIKKGILHRVQVLYVLFFIIGLMIVGKILYLQYGPKSGRLRSEGTTITYERVAMEADRGDILACDGRILATSVPEYEVRMDFAANGLVDSIFLRDVDSLAYCLSDFFGDKSKSAYAVAEDEMVPRLAEAAAPALRTRLLEFCPGFVHAFWLLFLG